MPVYTIQPVGAAAQDSWMDSGEILSRHGLDATVKFGAATTTKRAIIEFPLRGIRTGAVVSDTANTKIVLSAITNPGTSFTGRCARITRYDWDQLTVSHNEFVAGVSWTTSGGDVGATPATFTFTVPTSGDLTLTGSGLVGMIQDALDKRAARLLIRLVYSSGTAGDFEFASGQYTDDSKTPLLSVETSETNLGYGYHGIKRSIGAWCVSRGERQSESHARYAAVGVGTSPETDWQTRRRLKSEAYRVPLVGATLDATNFRSDFWAVFGSGEGLGTLTELGIFADDTTTHIDGCDSLSGWTLSSGSPLLDTNQVAQGATSITFTFTGAGTHTITRSGLSVDLSGYSLDDYLMLWLLPFSPSHLTRVTSITVVMTDDQGTWTWTGVRDLLTVGWNNLGLKFGDATSSVSASGPSIMSSIQLTYVITTTVQWYIDHLRVLKGEEDILAWAPISMFKATVDKKKFFIRLTALRGTN